MWSVALVLRWLLSGRIVHVSLRLGQLLNWVVWCAINRIMFYTSQHMTTLATRSTCVPSRTWELERMAWQRTQTALPGTQDELPYLVKCINNYFFVSRIFFMSSYVSRNTHPFFLYRLPPFILLNTRRIPHLFLSFSFSSSTRTSHFSSIMHAL